MALFHQALQAVWHRKLQVTWIAIFLFTLFYVLPPISSIPDYLPKSVDPTVGHIPRHMWQIYFPPRYGDHNNQLRYVDEWTKVSPNFTHTLVGREDGAAFVEEYFPGDVFETYTQLRNPAMKSDFLRYLLLSAKGGYYSDLDTKPVKPLGDWLPLELRSKIKIVVAPEHDDGVNDAGEWLHPVQFCQWAMAAAPGHPALERIIQRAHAGLRELAEKQGVGLDALHPTDHQVMNATGPPAWTEVIFDAIQKADPEITSYYNLSRLAEPRVFGDILLLPIDAFMTLSEEMRVLPGAGSHQLVHHDFSGAWKVGG